MNTVRTQGGYLIMLTLLITFILSIIPLPRLIEAYRLDWTLLVLIYWALALPHRVNVGVAWICGFLLDVLLGTVLGTHALSCSIVIYVAGSNYQKIRNFSVWQQSLIIGLFLALHHLLVYWFSHFLSDTYFLPEYLYPVLSGVLVWPWMFWLLRKFRRQFSIN
ncbi:MAG: rod shape-determining protein MreD [Alteromonadaceae bacterium]|jgi:rod shape-determining protein MreD